MKKILTLLLSILISLFIINCGGSSDSSTPPIDNNQSTPMSNLETNPIVSTEENSSNPIINSPSTNIASSVESNITLKFKLSETLKESSGLIHLNNQLWTHNDSGDEAKLYQIDKETGEILKSISITNATIHDWEDITYDDTHLYIGDFGNNFGNRRELKIYKISRSDLLTETATTAEVINFTYSDQTDFSSKLNAHNFDCEAMVAHEGKLYLFSKNWNNLQTRLYELETTAGTHIAHYKSSFDTKALVTGASLNKELGILLLTTYSKRLNVSILSFSNFNNSEFFNGTSKQLTLMNPLQSQIEGITFVENYKAYLSSEAYSNATYGIRLDSNLYKLDFSKEFE